MNNFSVALLAIDAPEVPSWIPERLKSSRIDFLVSNCLTSSEFLENGRNADLIWIFGSNPFVSAQSIAPLLPQLTRCGAILRTGSGTDNIPVPECTTCGIIVANTPNTTADEVANHALGLLFAVTRQIAQHDSAIRRGIWDRYYAWPNWHFTGKILGLVGFGHIAKLVAHKVSGLGMIILAHDPLFPEGSTAVEGVRFVGLETLMREADFISLHCPLIESTRHLISESRLRLMKNSAVLINTARGGIVDEPALVRALQEKWIAAAGLDVLEQEPPKFDNPLLGLANVVLTPHIASYSDLSFDSLWRASVEVVLDLAQHRWPISVVNRIIKPRWTMQDRDSSGT